MPRLVTTDELPGANLLDTRQVAELLNVSTTLVEQWRASGEGPTYIKMGRLIRYRVEDVDKFITKNTVEHE